ncbi:MAG: hypothetical protein JWN29_2066 [Acidimicrobiales bacterium]|nr:hypothetical protein [Actinomycetes bacterium]MCU1379083.1 hypothetical protein [Acidimicrobiales bacterium]
MRHERLLICTVTEEGGHLVCACVHCGWVSSPVATGSDCGALWDLHMAVSHARPEPVIAQG